MGAFAGRAVQAYSRGTKDDETNSNETEDGGAKSSEIKDRTDAYPERQRRRMGSDASVRDAKAMRDRRCVCASLPDCLCLSLWCEGCVESCCDSGWEGLREDASDPVEDSDLWVER